MRTDFATLARWSEIMECGRLRVRCATAPPRFRKATGKLSNERAVEHQRCIRLGCAHLRGRLIGTPKQSVVVKFDKLDHYQTVRRTLMLPRLWQTQRSHKRA